MDGDKDEMESAQGIIKGRRSGKAFHISAFVDFILVRLFCRASLWEISTRADRFIASARFLAE